MSDKERLFKSALLVGCIAVNTSGLAGLAGENQLDTSPKLSLSPIISRPPTGEVVKPQLPPPEPIPEFVPPPVLVPVPVGPSPTPLTPPPSVPENEIGAGQSVVPFAGFLRVAGMDGESTDSSHEGWIEILSLKSGVESDAKLRVSKPTFLGLTVRKTVDKATPKLAAACASGRHIPLVDLDLLIGQSTQSRRFRMRLEDVSIVSLKNSWGDQWSAPEEIVEFAAQKISWTMQEALFAGGALTEVSAGWDFLNNIAVGAGTIPLFQTSASLSVDRFTISWPAEAGQTYFLLASVDIRGPYQILQMFRADSTGTLTAQLPVAASSIRFFVVQKTQP